VFDFLGLSGRVAEREFQAALVARLRDTLLEFGTGFAFVGQQVHFDVGGDDFYIDCSDSRVFPILREEVRDLLRRVPDRDSPGDLRWGLGVSSPT